MNWITFPIHDARLDYNVTMDGPFGPRMKSAKENRIK